MQDSLEGLPALGGAQLVCIGEVVLRRDSAEEGFLVLVGRVEVPRLAWDAGVWDTTEACRDGANIPWIGPPSGG